MIPLAKCNAKKLSKINKPKLSKQLLLFLAVLNSLINHNIFEQDLCHKYEQKANVILRKKQSKVQLAQYLHTTCLSLMLHTFIKAINNNDFISWPGLIANLIRKHLPKKHSNTSRTYGYRTIRITVNKTLSHSRFILK